MISAVTGDHMDPTVPADSSIASASLPLIFAVLLLLQVRTFIRTVLIVSRSESGKFEL